MAVVMPYSFVAPFSRIARVSSSMLLIIADVKLSNNLNFSLSFLLFPSKVQVITHNQSNPAGAALVAVVAGLAVLRRKRRVAGGAPVAQSSPLPTVASTATRREHLKQSTLQCATSAFF